MIGQPPMHQPETGRGEAIEDGSICHAPAKIGEGKRGIRPVPFNDNSTDVSRRFCLVASAQDDGSLHIHWFPLLRHWTISILCSTKAKPSFLSAKPGLSRHVIDAPGKAPTSHAAQPLACSCCQPQYRPNP